jgi:hypothetical protein
MTTKDFKKLAEFLNRSARNPWIENNAMQRQAFQMALDEVAQACKIQNGRFDRRSFLTDVFEGTNNYTLS